jgi:hypothetical protein
MPRVAVDILALHHATKSEGKIESSERGSSAFIDATDTAIRLKRTDRTIKVVCKKQKDAGHFEPFALHMKVISLPPTEEGEEMESCVLTSGDCAPPCSGPSADHLALLSALAEFPGGRGQRLQWLEKVDLPERTFERRRDELVEMSYIEGTDERGVYKMTIEGRLAIAKHSPTSSQGKVA